MNYLDKLPQIRTFILDVDGVITDGSILVTENGEMLRRFSMQDGYAMQHAVKAGYRICIISGGRGKGILERLQGLGITDVYLAAANKLGVYHEYVDTYGLDIDKILYMGDDLPDYEVMKAAYMACAPANAVPEIKELADYISPYRGGAGAVRNVIEMVLKVQGKWPVNETE